MDTSVGKLNRQEEVLNQANTGDRVAAKANGDLTKEKADQQRSGEGQGIPAVSRMSAATGCALKPTSDFSNKLGQPRHGSGILQAINSSLDATTTGLETAAAKEMTTDIMQPQHKFSKSGTVHTVVSKAATSLLPGNNLSATKHDEKQQMQESGDLNNVTAARHTGKATVPLQTIANRGTSSSTPVDRAAAIICNSMLKVAEQTFQATHSTNPGGADVQVAAAPARVAQHLEGQKDRGTALQADSPSSNGQNATHVTGSVAGIERRVVPSKKQTPKKNKMQQAEQNHFDALYNANVVDGMNTEENLQLVESNAADQNSSLTPVAINLTALGSQILNNMNPMQAFTRNRSPIPIMQLDKAEFDNNTIYKVRLNTSNKHIPSNDTVNCSEDSVHPAHNLQDHAMMISAVPKSWADQAEMEKDNDVDSADSYRATVKKNT
ncbi:hypothetical protein A4A49_42775, partial [Nicotiana attenuata]